MSRWIVHAYAVGDPDETVASLRCQLPLAIPLALRPEGGLELSPPESELNVGAAAVAAAER
jgi:hypothetical protein